MFHSIDTDVKYLVIAGMCQLGGVGGHFTLQYLQICKKVGQKAAMLEEIWQVFLGPFSFLVTTFQEYFSVNK